MAFCFYDNIVKVLKFDPVLTIFSHVVSVVGRI